MEFKKWSTKKILLQKDDLTTVFIGLSTNLSTAIVNNKIVRD